MEYSTRGQYSKISNYSSNYAILDNNKFSKLTDPYSTIIIPDFINKQTTNNNLTNNLTKQEEQPQKSINTPSTCQLSTVNSVSSCSVNNQKLLPILDPMFNLKEVSKHLILLEDHLFQMGRRCKDCIIKHIYTIEAFLEEAITLDTNGENVKFIENTQMEFKSISNEILDLINQENINTEKIHSLAQKLRNLRKPLMYKTVNLKE
jgi:hypothetical protein